MDFFQSVFSNDEYKYFLEDNPCPHVGLIGCEDVTRSAIINALAGLQYRPPRLFVTSHSSMSTVYTKKSTITNKNLGGVMKLGWWKKHQERVLGCAVLLVDWDLLKSADKDRVQLEAIMQKHLDSIKAHLKVPYASNTRIIIGLVTNAKSLSDPSPCGCYASIDEAQSSLRSRLGLNDRNLLALYQRGMDQYSVQRLENMIMEQVGRYHRDEISRLRKVKGEANDTANATAAANAGGGNPPQPQHDASSMEAVFIARNRFKIAWHATVAKDVKLARRSWEKCYNALHSLPPPLSIDRWVIATIALWKLISDNFQRFSNVTVKEAPDAGASIETDIQAFLIHLNWVNDNSFVYHGGPSDERLAPRAGEPTPALVISRLSDAEAMHVMAREWYMADFYTMVANRLDTLKTFLPKAGACLESRIVCLPAYHLQNVVRCLTKVRDVMVSRLTLLEVPMDPNHPTALGLMVLERARPEGSPLFIGHECTEMGNMIPLLTTVSLFDLVGRIKANLFNAIVWYQSYGLVQLTSTMQLEVAEHDLFVGAYGDAIARLNRLLKDPLLSQWRDICVAIHEVRYRASAALMGSSSSRQTSPSNHVTVVPAHSRTVSASDGYFASPVGALTLHRDMLSSLMYLLFHSSHNASRAQKFKAELSELNAKYALKESVQRAGESSLQNSLRASTMNSGVGTMNGSITAPFVDVSPVTMADRVEGSSGKGTIRSGKGFRMCHVTAEDAIIFPLIKVYTHFTRPFVESWKGALAGQDSEERTSSGLTISIECSATTPLRLYNVELQLYHVLPSSPSDGGRRRRELVPTPVRLCWSEDAQPSYFIEVSNKAPVWSTTILSLPFLTALEAGTYECGGMSAQVFISQSNVSSIPAVVRFDRDDESANGDSFDNTARRRSSPRAQQECGPARLPKSVDYSGARSCYAALPPQAADASHTCVPVHYNFSVAVEDDYVALFEDYCFDSADNRVHLFLTSQAHQQRGMSQGPTAASGSGRVKARSTSFAYPTVGSSPVSGRIAQRAAVAEMSRSTTGANSSLATFANILLLEGHRFGTGSSPGCFYSHLHRPIMRLTRPVAKMVMETIAPAGQQVLEGDDHLVTLALESRGDTMLSGRVLIPFIEDVVELVEVSLGGSPMEMADVTGDSPAIAAATPVGYRIAEVRLTPHSLMPDGPNQRLVLHIKVRCSYAGYFEMPIRLDYSTPRCDAMALLHMARLHVCRPFISSFKLYDLHALDGKGGDERAAITADGSDVPDVTRLSPPIFGSSTGASSGFDPFAAVTAGGVSTALPLGTSDLMLSEFMSICYGERQELVSIQRIADIQRGFDRDPRMANIIVNAAAQRLLKAHEAAAHAPLLPMQQQAHNQFYHVDRQLSVGQSVQSTPDRFHLHQNSPFVVRACFINTIRCPVRVERLEIQLAEGVSAAFTSQAPSSQVLIPGEEITFALQVKSSRCFGIDECIGKLALHVRRAEEAPGRAVDPTIAALHGGGHPLRFVFHFPRVVIVEQVYTCRSSYPTTVFLGEPFVLKVSINNSSAVPSKKLRLHFSGASLDRHFLLTGRTQTSFVVPGLGSTVVSVTMAPLAAGSFNLPTFELISDDDVYARAQDIHTVEVLPPLAKK